jgi:hypothetical protein
MRISQWTGTLSAAAAIALLAGCSGGSQYAPSAAGGTGASNTTMSARHGVANPTIVGPFASQRLNDSFYHRPIVDAVRVNPDKKKPGCKKAKKKGLVFASDNSTGNLDAYCGHAGGVLNANQNSYKTVSGGAGWGLAVHGAFLAAGVTGGTVTVYNLPALTVKSTLTLTHGASGYNAYGLSWTSGGGLYATEWPGPYLDYFSTPTTTGAATCYNTLSLMSEAYYASAHGSTVDVYGFNGFSSQVPAVVENDSNAACSGTFSESLVGTFGSLADGNGFPGGTTVNASGELFVNNQYGTLYDDGAYPGSNSPKGACSWGFDPNDYTNINMSTKQNSIWGSNINFGSSPLVTMLGSFSTSITSGSCATGASGGPTANVTDDEFLGTAAWPNTGGN